MTDAGPGPQPQTPQLQQPQFPQNVLLLCVAVAAISIAATWQVGLHAAADRLMQNENAALRVQVASLTNENNELRARLSMPPAPRPGRPGATNGATPEPTRVDDALLPSQ